MGELADEAVDAALLYDSDDEDGEDIERGAASAYGNSDGAVYDVKGPPKDGSPCLSPGCKGTLRLKMNRNNGNEFLGCSAWTPSGGCKYSYDLQRVRPDFVRRPAAAGPAGGTWVKLEAEHMVGFTEEAIKLCMRLGYVRIGVVNLDKGGEGVVFVRKDLMPPKQEVKF